MALPWLGMLIPLGFWHTCLCSAGTWNRGLTLPCATVRLENLILCFSMAEMPITSEVSAPTQHQDNRRSVGVQTWVSPHHSITHYLLVSSRWLGGSEASPDLSRHLFFCGW